MTEDWRRWDIDERGVGIADATDLAPAIERAGHTGVPPGTTSFAAHGHTLRLRIVRTGRAVDDD